MESKRYQGSCLCGQIRYEIEARFQTFRYCHCPRCQKASGTGHVTNLFAEPDAIKWLAGEGLLARFDLPEAKSFAKCFCTVCGSPMPHRTRSGRAVIVPVGTLDDDPEIRPESSIFWDARAAWYVEPDEMPKHSEYEK